MISEVKNPIDMPIVLTQDGIDQIALRRQIPQLPDCGGYACFEGIVRNTHEKLERKVRFLDYSAYEPLALCEMQAIAQEACIRYDLKYAQITHRFGRIYVGETAVMIQVLSRHRAEAFAGCHMLIDQIKLRVPIWKKEHYVDGHSQWVLCSHQNPEIQQGKRQEMQHQHFDSQPQKA